MIETPQPHVPRAGPTRPAAARPIVLVGLMGAGKTSVGKRLAALLGVPFADSDAEIVEAAGMSIPEIFASLGEPAFRDGERRVIARLLAERPGVLATGGGAFIEARTRAEIAARATSVWLRADLDLLWDRVRDRPGRPLLQTADPQRRARRPAGRSARRSTPRPTSSSTAGAAPATRRWRGRSSPRCAPGTRAARRARHAGAP